METFKASRGKSAHGIPFALRSPNLPRNQIFITNTKWISETLSRAVGATEPVRDLEMTGVLIDVKKKKGVFHDH